MVRSKQRNNKTRRMVEERQRERDLEFEGAERVGDVLERIDDAVGVLVAWIDAPSVSDVGVGRILDAIRQEISHVFFRPHLLLSDRVTD